MSSADQPCKDDYFPSCKEKRTRRYQHIKRATITDCSYLYLNNPFNIISGRPNILIVVVVRSVTLTESAIPQQNAII